MQQKPSTETLKGRVVFISASFLWREKNYTQVPGTTNWSLLFWFTTQFKITCRGDNEGCYLFLWQQEKLAYVHTCFHFCPFNVIIINNEVFPSNEEERRDAARQPTPYAKMEQAFKEVILEKEKAGLVYWLKPDCDYRKVFVFIFNPSIHFFARLTNRVFFVE